jgi:hypothetical protein
MSFLLLREFSLFYIFISYVFFYFSVDEEFVIFLVILFWILLFIVFYLKVVSNSFNESLVNLSNEYFFFHNKKNMFLAIFRDQNTDFINLNDFIDNFLCFFFKRLYNDINYKIIAFYNLSNLYLGEFINFIKNTKKTMILLFHLTTFSYIYKILIIMVNEISKLFNIFFKVYYKLRKNIELNLLEKNYNKLNFLKIYFSENNNKGLFNIYKNITNLRVFDLNKNYILKKLQDFLINTKELNENRLFFFENVYHIINFFNLNFLILNLRNILRLKKGLKENKMRNKFIKKKINK